MSAQVPVMCLLTYLVLRDVFSAKYIHESKFNDEEVLPYSVLDDSSCSQPPCSSIKFVMLIFFATSILFIYDGLQAAYGGYIFSYGVSSIEDMGQSEAAYVNAFFWGTFAFGRLVAIFIATRVSPQWLLLGNITGCTAAMVLLVSLPHNHVVLILGSGLFGFFLSCVFPTTISLTEHYVHVSSLTTSILVMAAASGEMIMPLIVGYEFEDYGPTILLVTGVSLTVTSFLLYSGLYFIGRSILKPSGAFGDTLDWVMNGSKNKCTEGTGLMTSNVQYYSKMNSGSTTEGLLISTPQKH